MKVTYIGHSGFMVEWEDVVCLFDWVEGELPETDRSKRLYAFVSHSHPDHFTPELFARCGAFPRRTFLLSSDVKAALPKGDAAALVRMSPEQHRLFAAGKKGVMSVTTLRSTDLGVAFVVNYGGKTIYHAGDLHLWAWPDGGAEAEKQMKERFSKEVGKLKGLPLDAAFLPLDPRLEENFWMGFDAVMRTAEVGMAFPMHMWEKYGYIDSLRDMPVSEPYRDRIARITGPGQTFEI